MHLVRLFLLEQQKKQIQKKITITSSKYCHDFAVTDRKRQSDTAKASSGHICHKMLTISSLTNTDNLRVYSFIRKPVYGSDHSRYFL